MDKDIMRFDLFNAFYPIEINDIKLSSLKHRLVNVVVDTPENVNPKQLDALLSQNNPDLHRAYLFSFKVVSTDSGAKDTLNAVGDRQSLSR